MKYFVLFLAILASLSGSECVIPTGYEVINTLSENGVLSVVDKYGNGADIYVDTGDVDIDAEIGLYKQDSHVVLAEEMALFNGGHLLRFDPQTKLYPVDTFIIIPGENTTVSANLLKLGDPSTHEVFEKDVILIMRSIAQGGRYEKVWFDCFGVFSESDNFVSGKSGSAGSSSVQGG